jgi:membrane-associated phospholipid phosphatase
MIRHQHRTGRALLLGTLLALRASGVLAQASPTTPIADPLVTAKASPSRPHSLWHDLFLDTIGDARRLPSRGTALWLAAGALGAAGTHAADARVARWSAHASRLQTPLGGGAFLGSTPLHVAAAIAAYSIGRSTGRDHLTNTAAEVVRADLLAQVLTLAAKQGIRRSRPAGTGFAFPSGHTSTTFATATVLQRRYGWKIGVPAYALASYVGLSRIQTQRHYLSDVVFGAALGMVVGRTVTIGREWPVAVGPILAPGGVGVSVTWNGRQGKGRSRGVPSVP